MAQTRRSIRDLAFACAGSILGTFGTLATITLGPLLMQPDKAEALEYEQLKPKVRIHYVMQKSELESREYSFPEYESRE